MDITWQYGHIFVFEFILLGYVFSFVSHMSLAQFSVQKVTPQSDGSSSKVKVKVRVNVHGIFSVSSASLVEVHKFEENEEPMETDQSAKEEEKMQLDQEEPHVEEQQQQTPAENRVESEEMEV